MTKMEPRSVPQATTDSSAALAWSHLTDSETPNACAQQRNSARRRGEPRNVTDRFETTKPVDSRTDKTPKRDNSSRRANAAPLKNVAWAEGEIRRSWDPPPARIIPKGIPRAHRSPGLWEREDNQRSTTSNNNDTNDTENRRRKNPKRMADKLSSPSSSSSTGYSGTQTPQSKGGNGDAHLVVRKPPPTHVFPNETFEFEVMLELARLGSPAPQEATVELEVSLLHVKKAKPVGPEEARLTIITGGRPIVLATSGPQAKRQAKITCQIDTATIRRDTGASFLIYIKPKQVVPGMAGVTTNPIEMVNYKTHILMEEKWETEWFKDEGGRDKCMEVSAEIRDRNGQRRTGERIPFELLLCYNSRDVEGGHLEVINQDLLRVLGTSTSDDVVRTEKDTGRARIRFRIEDVSKNHQAQGFKVKVGPPNKLKDFKDIAPGYTPSVLVRSKRNKGTKGTRTGTRTGGKRKIGDAENHASPTRVERNVRVSVSEQSTQRDISFENVDVVRLREAMKGVINWTDEVVNGLYPLQWLPIGYAPNPDGSPDRSRPYFTMPNPNACISRVLSMYAASTRENLRVLLSAVEQAGPQRQDETSYGSGSVVREQEQSYEMMGTVMHPQQQQQQHQPQQGIPAHLSSGQFLHPNATSDAFRGIPENPAVRSVLYHQQSSPPAAAMPPRHPQMQYAHSRPPPQVTGMLGDDSDNMSMHSQRMQQPTGPHGHMPMDTKPPATSGDTAAMPVAPMQTFGDFDSEEVYYVLAKQYNSVRTGDHLGYPAYNRNREIQGFYRGNTKMGGHVFTPISMLRSDFGPLQFLQANSILTDAIQNSTNLVYEVTKFGGDVNKLLDHLMVYDWTKDVEPASLNLPRPSTG